MGGGGEAPPVKGEDVMILVGSSILLITFIMHAWVSPSLLEEGSEFVVNHDMGDGDEFTLTIESGEVSVFVKVPGDDSYTEQSIGEDSEEWIYSAENDGLHSFKIVADDGDVEFIQSISRGIILDFMLYPLGAAILGFGIWKKKMMPEEEEPEVEVVAIDAVLEG